MKRIIISLLFIFAASFGFARTINDFDLGFEQGLELLLNEITPGGDVVYLTNGTTVEGVITEQNAETLTVQKASGELVTIKISDVRKVESRLNAGEYTYTITSQFGSTNIPQVTPPVKVDVANNNTGEEITLAADFHGDVFPHLTFVKAKDSPKEAGKGFFKRMDHYVGDGVDFNGAEFEKFIKMYCPESNKHYKKQRINTYIGSGVILTSVIIGAALGTYTIGIVDAVVGFFFYGCAIYHMKKVYKSYEEIYAGKPFPGNDGTQLLMPVETPVYSITPITEMAE